MKAEERKHLKENELQTGLSKAWDLATSNSPTATRVWTGILVVLIAVLGWVIYSRLSVDQSSVLWSRLDFAYNDGELKKIVDEHPNSPQATIANFHLARIKATDGLSRLGTPGSSAVRDEAASKLDEARKLYIELMKKSDLLPSMAQETLLQLGKIEENLATVPTEDGKFRGSIDTAAKYYEDLKAKHPATPFGEEAGQRAETLRKKKAEIDQLNEALARVNGKGIVGPAGVEASPPVPAPPAPITPAPSP